MRRSLAVWIALVGLTALPAAVRAEGPASGKPAFVVRVASVDNMLADLRRLAEMVGKAEEVGNLEAILNNLGEGGGLNKAIDRKKPVGVYGWAGAQGIPDVVVLVPVSDEKAVVDFVSNTLGTKPEKGQDGIYTVNVEKVPFPLFAAFADGYCYVSNNREALGKHRLSVADVLPEGKIGVVWATFHIDRVASQLKQIALGQVDLSLADAKEKPAKSDEEAKIRSVVLDGASTRVKSLLRDGGTVDVRVTLDRATNEFSVSVSVAGKPGSELANQIRDLANRPSVAAALFGSDSALNAMVHVRLPEEVRERLKPVVEDLPKKAGAKAHSDLEREIIRTLLESIEPTLKSGELDAGLDVRGPGGDGLYTIVVGVRVKDGAGIEKAVRDVYKKVPDEVRGHVKLDADKAGDVAIHRITPDNVKEETRKVIGDGPIYVAVRDDAVLVAAGEKALDALKEAVAAQPKPGRIAQVEASLLRLAPLLEKENKGAGEAAKKAFREKGSDKVRITIQGGEALEVRISGMAQLIRFARLLDEKHHKGD
jgi:hypothetical protein